MPVTGVGVSVNAPTTPSDHRRAMAAMIRVRARHSPGSEPAVGCEAPALDLLRAELPSRAEAEAAWALGCLIER